MSAIERFNTGWFDVSSLLENFVTTTWTVEPERLARLLPTGLEPDLYTLQDGTRTAFLSAVSFVNTQFHVRFAPFVRLTAAQTNYRVYVRRGAEHSVWFCLTQLDSIAVLLPRYGFGMPWDRMRTTHDASWKGERLQRLQWHATSQNGVEQLDLTGTGLPIGVHDGFKDEAESRRVLTHPLVGYFQSPRGRLGRYGVTHAPLELERCQPREVRYEAVERMGLIEPKQAPISVLAQRATQYTIFLPPRRVELNEK